MPHYTFGLDVIVYISELRYQQQRTIIEIHTALHAAQVKLSLKEVLLLSEVFLALVETVSADDPQTVATLQAQGGIILSVDGMQPEKGNETLWLLRDVTLGRVLVARNLRSSSVAELVPLFEQVQQLDVPVLVVVSVAGVEVPFSSGAGGLALSHVRPPSLARAPRLTNPISSTSSRTGRRRSGDVVPA